jgi:translation initiation factor 2 beta subunit (eIF-2beta)/eIF-5
MENIIVQSNGIHDPYQRYKMPRLIIIHRKGHTIIENIDEISKSLNRSPNEMMKMFSQNLGTSMNMKNKSVPGIHTFEQLNDHLRDYIDNYILCSDCGNPETQYAKIKNQLAIKCSACSGVTKLDGNSKLSRYILSKF